MGDVARDSSGPWAVVRKGNESWVGVVLGVRGEFAVANWGGSATAGQGNDFQAVAVLEDGGGVFTAGDEVLVAFDGDGFAGQSQLFQELGHGRSVWVLLWLVIYDNMHGGTRASGWWGAIAENGQVWSGRILP